MNKLKKTHAWVIDYIYMVYGGALMTLHKNPPKHYLGYIIKEKAPVILIPGILGKWGFMKHLGDRISLAGHPVYIVPKLKYNIYSIPTAAKKVRELLIYIIPRLRHIIPNIHVHGTHIHEFIKKHGIKGAVLVAHSKGGLIGKYLLIHHNNDQRIKGLIAIATPFSGSSMARLIPHDSFKELDTDSAIIHDLGSHTDVNQKIISIIPEFDNHIWAKNGSYLKGALDNIEIPIGGHSKIMFSKIVEDKVLELIEKLSKR